MRNLLSNVGIALYMGGMYALLAVACALPVAVIVGIIITIL